MVITKTKAEIEKMLRAGQLLARLLQELSKIAQPGVSTLDLDQYAERRLKEAGAISPFKGYRGYPKNICASINEQVVHAIPSNRILKDGDIISIDAGVLLDGYVADAAVTVGVGQISDVATRLIADTEKSLHKAIEKMQPGNRLYDISYAVQSYIEPLGYSLVKEFCGHGVGRKMHEEPQVPNCGHRPNTGPRLRSGWVLAVEPMVNVGTASVRFEKDGWTVVTLDGRLSAHFEHTVAITDNGPLILTQLQSQP
jgi:methionyl aminopeptidase